LKTKAICHQKKAKKRTGRIYGNEISFNVKHEERRRHQKDKRNKIKQSKNSRQDMF
jgi:glutaredoxin